MYRDQTGLNSGSSRNSHKKRKSARIAADRRTFPRFHQERRLLKAERVACLRPSAKLKEMYGPHGASSYTARIFPRIDAASFGFMQRDLESKASSISARKASRFVQGPGDDHRVTIDLISEEKHDEADHWIPFVRSDTAPSSVIPWPTEKNECRQETLLESRDDIIPNGTEAVVIDKTVVVKTFLFVDGQRWILSISDCWCQL
jgi:hypothetical protein